MLTRRTLLASSAATVAAPAVLTEARAATPKGVAVMAKQIDDIVSFDPAESYEFTNGEVDANCYRRLIRPDLDDATKIEGDLAEKWDVSKDGLTFTFKLRRDAKFDSGNPVTAHDAAFSLHRVVKLNKTPGFIVTQFGFNPDNVEKAIRALDDYTLEMKLPEEAEATSFVLYCLSANVGSVVDMKTVMANQANGDLGNGWLKTRTAGAGPYKLTEWAASDHVIIDTNPHAEEKAADATDRAAPRRRSVGAASFAAEGRRGHSARPRLRSAQVARRRQEPDGHVGATRHVDVHRDEPGDAGAAEGASASGDQMGNRLRCNRQEHHAEYLERLPDIPSRCAARCAEEHTVQEGCGEGQAIVGRGGSGQRIFGHDGLHFSFAPLRYCAGDPGGSWRQSASR